MQDLESKTIFILREAYRGVRPLGMLWSMGKDSTALLWMVRKAFFGRVPFPVILLDTGMELPEVYEFRDWLTREWKLECITWECPPLEEMDEDLQPAGRAAMRKTQGLKNLIAEKGYKGMIVGIRRDEEGRRAKERIFSPRDVNGIWDFKNQPPEFGERLMISPPPDGHLRIHPLLHWTEADIWRYTKQEDIPCVPLYFAQNGFRYRSLGERNITFPVPSEAATFDEIIAELEATNTAERAGRTMDHESEDGFEKLRARGYM